jgi:DNA polymerase-3 subunit beta
MKFKSERDILVEALSAASRVVATRLIGASSGVLLSLTGNQLVVTGTDLDITVRTSVDVIGIEDGSSVVPARLIVDAVRSLEAGAVTISSNDENVEVSLGRAKFSLRTFSVVDYPKLPPVTGSARGRQRRRTPPAHRRVVYYRQRRTSTYRYRLLSIGRT